MNSLSRGIGPPAPTQPSSSSPSSNHGKGHVLETTSITGDNVYVVVPPKFDEPIVTEPQPKRRKVEISYNSKETPQLIDEEEEEDDILSMEYSRVQHKTRSDGSQDARRTLNALAVDSTESSNRNGRFRGGIPEYKVVEHVMDSRPPKTKRYRVGQEKEGHLDGTSTKRSSLASSETNSVEVLDAGRPQQEAKTLYKGTARAPLILEPSGDINHALHAHSTGKQSPHFLPPTSSRTATGGNGSDEIGGIHEKAIERRGLRFRDENNLRGKWLSSEVNLSSPDELAAAKPSSRELSPVKFAQSASPTKEPSLDLQGSEFLKSDIETGLEKSNIQPSHFTKHGVKTTAFRGPAFQNTHSKEKAATWSMPFASFNFNGETRSSNNLAFVFDESGESLNIHEAGRDIAAQEPSLRLQPRKLQKILWAIKGVKIRFVSSKCGVHDNVLDVEMKSADDITVLLQKLQEGCSIRVLGMASEHMSRLFSHRLSEQQKAPSVSVTSRAAETPTVYLDESRRGLMEAKRPQEDNEQITAKRPRLSDNLRVRDENYTNIQSRDLSPKLKRPPESTDSLTTRRDSDIDNWIERLEQRKYSLRSSNQSNIISQRPRDILSTLELSSFLFFPQEQRFSKLHGLGEQWKKPLTYPMEGKKRTTVDWGDLERLDEGEFLNDNLIAFYLRFLEHKMEQKTPDVARRVYIFNTFFYERLSSTSKGQKGINYPAVQKWTRGVDIYTYDYVVVPVNESAHWYVAIICNLPALNRSLALPEEGHDLPSAPTELTLDRYAKQQGVDAEVEGDVLDSKEIFPSLSPSEQEATASFRAMTLDAQASKDSSPKGLRGGDDGAEKAMLNKLTEPPMDQNDDIRAEELAEIGLGTTDQDIKADDESKATDTKKGLSTQYTRKGKRKSIPPVRTLNPNKPCIITFDSLGSPHFATIRILKDYLQEEARDKRPEMEFDDNELKGMTAKQIPQQDNFCDCGLFLLGYMEKFFDDPKDFITKVVKREYDVKKDWPKLDPSVMRANLRDMLQSLYREQSNNRQVKRQAAINAGKYVGKQQKEPFSDQKHPQNVPNLKPAKSLIVDEKHSGAQEPREAQPEAKAGYGKVLDVERADLHEVLIDDSKVDAGPSLKKQVADTMSTSPVRQAEQQQESLIVLDSQPQPGSLTLSPEKRELNPDIAAPAFEQPSTIEDSQPRRKSPSDDLPSPPPPVVPKRRRRVSRSNPTSPRTIRSPEMQTRASERISSKTKSSPVVGRRPKVIVEID
ncbi:MAG: hypothetical protein LQ351_007580 [Letrouitia transgressa]|nr:MAG: hypothetical protein LQ351_007580 [Letrouitia transgressa]